MWKTLAKSIITSILFSGSFLSCTHAPPKLQLSPDFENGKYFASISEYEKAEPFLLKTVVREDENYSEAVLILGKVYDQLSMPEKSILNLRDYIERGGSQENLLKAKALLLKNLAKAKVNIETAEEKQFITRVLTSKIIPTKDALEALRWTLDFNCALYCAEEVVYLKEIQVQLLYATEVDPSLHSRVFDILTSRYDFFETYLKDNARDLSYRKKVAQNLYEALQKLKSAHLENNTLGSVKTAELVNYLDAYQKRIERWLYL